MPFSIGLIRVWCVLMLKISYDLLSKVSQKEYHIFRHYRNTPLKTMSAHVTIAASVKQTATIIFLHGLGDTGHGWSSTIAAIRPKYAKCVCPTAKTMPVTLNGGYSMPSWFDLYSLDANGPIDEDGIIQARDLIHGIISDEEKQGTPANRIILGGFSQGGALALYSALTYSKPLAGVLAFSCWMPLHNQLGGVGPNKDVPVLQCHGDSDPIVPFIWGQITRDFLKNILTNYEFKSYNGMGHSSCDAELRDAKEFFAKHLPSI